MPLALTAASLLALLPVAFGDIGPCRLTRSEGEGGIPLLTIENDFVRLQLSPEQGGACRSFVVKRTGAELTAPGRDRKMFQEFVHGYKWDWVDANYEYDVLEEGPESIAVRLVKTGAHLAVKYCRFTKTLRLDRHSPVVRLEMEFLNLHESMATLHVPLRFFHSVEFAGRPTDYYLPTASGVDRVPYRRADASRDVFVYDAPRGWIAGLDADGESGFACDLEPSYRYLMCLYLWLGSQGFPTMEWMFRTQELPNGSRLSFGYSFMPFHGLSAVDGVGGGAASGFDGLAATCTPGDPLPVVARSWFGEPATGMLRLSARSPGRDAPVPLGEWPVQPRPDDVLTHACTFMPETEGTHVVVGELELDGQVVHTFERPVVAGGGEAEYVPAPREQRLGDDDERFSPGQPLLVRQGGEDPLAWTGGLTTPHVPWARPYARGKTRALVLCSYFQGREVPELAQRADLDLVTGTVDTGGSDNWTPWWLHGGNVAFTQARVTELLQGDYDVIVLGGLEGRLFNDEMTSLLEQQVRSGTGLVYIMPIEMPAGIRALLPAEEVDGQPYGRPETRGTWSASADHFVARGIPFDLLPETLYRRYRPTPGASVPIRVGADPLLLLCETEGMGRTAVLSYVNAYYAGNFAGLTPWFEQTPASTLPYWEYCHSLLARCLLWAARREPLVDFARLDAAASADGTARITVGLHNRGEMFAGIFDATVINRYGEEATRFQEAVVVPSGEALFVLDTDKAGMLPDGRHVAHVVLRTGGKSVNWGAATFEVTQPVGIRAIELPRRILRKGDVIEATVRLGSRAPCEVLARSELVDALGRVVDVALTNVVVDGDTTFAVRLALPEPVDTLHQLRVEILRDGVRLSHGQKELLAAPTAVAERRWSDYELAGWGSGPMEYPYLFPYKARAMRDAGITSIAQSTLTALWAGNRDTHERNFRQGFRIIPMSFMSTPVTAQNYREQKTQYARTKDTRYLERDPSFSDQAFLEKLQGDVQKAMEPLVELCPLAYCYSDEISLTRHLDLFDFDFSPAALGDFRTWLKHQYGALNRLNDQWETAFADWNAVMPMTMDEVRARPNKGPWADHRTFMEKTYADLYRTMGAALREIDPRAAAGLCGTQAPGAANGLDYSRLMQTFDFLFPYIDSGLLEIQGTLGRIPMAACNGYGRPTAFLKYEAWVTFLHGFHGTLYYHLRHFLNPNLTPRRDAVELSEIAQSLNLGLARLVGAAQREAQVAIHYSQSSLHLAGLEMKQDTFGLTRTGWLDLIEDLGLQADFITPTNIVNGSLARYSALVLPYSCAVSPEEADAIRQFVEGGGLLLADAQAGLFDAHGKPYPAGVLDDLFGINRHGAPERAATGAVGSLVFTSDYRDCRVNGRELYGSVVEPDLTTAGGTALATLADSPAFVVHAHGNGAAVYLNILPSSYSNSRKRGRETPLREIMRNVFRLSTARPPALVLENNTPLKVCQVVRFDAGAGDIIGVLQDYRNAALLPAQVRVLFDRERYVYHALTGERFGKTDEVATLIAPGEACLFSCLDYEVEEVGAVTAPSYAAGTEVRYGVRVDASTGMPGFHVVHVGVSGPDGKPCPHYARNVELVDGEGEGSFVLALNDPPGTWRLRLRDAATGVVAEHPFLVVP